MAWLPLASTTVNPARLDMARCATGGIIGETQDPVERALSALPRGWTLAGIGEQVVDGYVDPEFGGRIHVSGCRVEMPFLARQHDCQGY